MINSNLSKWFINRSKVLLSALVLTIIVFQLSEMNYTPLAERVIIYFYFQVASYGRTLLSSEDIKSICEKASGDLLKKYSQSEAFEYKSKSKGTKWEVIVDFIRDSDSSHIKDYITRILPYVIFLVLSIFFLISWIFYCCCCCCPCCCCRQKGDEKCCKCCSCFTALILYAGVVVGSVVALILSK